MKYISIGVVGQKSSEHILNISRGSYKFCLTGIQAGLWLNGRYGFSDTNTTQEEKELQQLSKMGLAVICDGSYSEEYRALAHCTLVPTEIRYPFLGIKGQENTILKWLCEAGLVLSMAELTYLIDRRIPLQQRLLGSDNAQALVEEIYTKETIFDNILENRMEHSRARDSVVDSVLKLLRKKRIILL